MKKNLLKSVVLSSMMVPFCITSAADYVVSFADTNGFGLDDNTIQINNIRLDTIINNPFDPAHPEISSLSLNIPYIFNYSTLGLDINPNGAVDHTSGACADLELHVTDAYTGLIIPNASVSIFNQTVQSDSNGTSSFFDLVRGHESVTASAPGYATVTHDVNLGCDGNSQGIALNPLSGEGAISTGDLRVVLSWGENPSDLDSHLTGPIASSSERFHTYFGDSDGSGHGASLDVDDTSSFGPETITAGSLIEGVYRYSVHHYSGSETISTSGANVTVNFPDGTVRTYNPPAGGSAYGDVWTVFEINITASGTSIIDVNTMEHGISASSVRSGTTGTATGYGSVENGVDWNNLPTK